jgi:hypothetical protein
MCEMQPSVALGSQIDTGYSLNTPERGLIEFTAVRAV